MKDNKHFSFKNVKFVLKARPSKSTLNISLNYKIKVPFQTSHMFYTSFQQSVKLTPHTA